MLLQGRGLVALTKNRGEDVISCRKNFNEGEDDHEDVHPQVTHSRFPSLENLDYCDGQQEVASLMLMSRRKGYLCKIKMLKPLCKVKYPQRKYDVTFCCD